MELRHWMVKDKEIKSIIKEIIKLWNLNQNYWKLVGKLRINCWVRYKPKHGNPKDGKIIEVTRNEVQVEIKRKRQLQHQSNQTEWWPKRKCKELKITEETYSLTEMKPYITSPPMSEIDTTEDENEKYVASGLQTIEYEETWIITDLEERGKDPNSVTYVASDGSVLDRKYMGTYAWIALTRDEKNNFKKLGIEGFGKEMVHGNEINEMASYRMEALALLSGLLYLRQRIRWNGKLHWYTDSKAVIDTYKKYKRKNSEPTHTGWIAQTDKDVWEMLLIEQKHWKNRIYLHHVESHVDKKKDELGNFRIPNSIQNMNIEADKLAEETYYTQGYWLNKTSLKTLMNAQIFMHNDKVTGHWRRQIEEQLRIDRTKHRAKQSPCYWGVNTEEISWRYMRKTVKKNNNRRTEKNYGTHARKKSDIIISPHMRNNPHSRMPPMQYQHRQTNQENRNGPTRNVLLH